MNLLKMSFTCVVLISLICLSVVVSSPTKNFKRSTTEAVNAQEYLDEHNAGRKGPASSDMKTLTWDDQLAATAQECADKCLFAHCRSGENIYLTSADSPAPTAAKVVAKWYGEGPDYNYGKDECATGKVCGHYTQVVWAKTSKLGCGQKFCESINVGTSVWEGAWLAVCQYDPPGNYVSVKPYTSGDSCTKCSDNQICQDGLCSDCNEGEAGCDAVM